MAWICRLSLPQMTRLGGQGWRVFHRLMMRDQHKGTTIYLHSWDCSMPVHLCHLAGRRTNAGSAFRRHCLFFRAKPRSRVWHQVAGWLTLRHTDHGFTLAEFGRSPPLPLGRQFASEKLHQRVRKLQSCCGTMMRNRRTSLLQKPSEGLYSGHWINKPGVVLSELAAQSSIRRTKRVNWILHGYIRF